MKQQRAIILDRDGVILEAVEGYLDNPKSAMFIPGSIDALCVLLAHDIPLGMATNQAGIAAGEVTQDQVAAIQRLIDGVLLDQTGRSFKAVRVCPHAKDAGCSCRKPKPGLLLAAANDMSVDPADCVYVGDYSDDWRAAINADMLPVLVRTGRGRLAELDIRSWYPGPFVRALTFDSLSAALPFLLDWTGR